MAAAVASFSFGVELKDSFKPVNAWVAGGIAWLDDIEQYYRERSSIEMEYAAKLSALAKKYHEKKARKIGPLSVGETPTMTPGSLESASLTTWSTQLTTLEKRSGEHERFAVELISQVADPLHHFAVKTEELRKNHAEYNTKLEKERDAAYTALKRMKGKYDGACQELESKRKKQDSSFDMNKTKAQQAYQQQILEMNNVKNTYLIAINVTNKSKEKYYHEYVPDVIDSLQDLNETRVKHLNSTWTKATLLEHGTLTRSADHMQKLSTEIPRNDPKLDSMMFTQHNRPSWQEPPDMGFEASPVWHDDAHFIIDEPAKVYLRNILSRSKTSLGELKREVDTKRRDVEKLRSQRQAIREGRAKGDEVNLVQLLFMLQGELHEAERKWMTAQTEVNTILSVVGDISLGAQNHKFKGTTFKIPTNCDLCGDRIWGLSAKGFDCKDCGYTCHSKCELKVPADCPGESNKEERKKLKAERQAAANAAVPVSSLSTSVNGGGGGGGGGTGGVSDDHSPPPGIAEMSGISRSNTLNSLSSGYAASAHRSVSGVAGSDTTAPSTTTSAPKAAIGGRKNRLVAPPPTQFVHDGPTSNGGSTELPTSTNSVPHGRMLYAYTASGDGELSIAEDAEFTVEEPDDGSGWMTVRNISTGESGVVPASYTERLLDAPAAPAIPLATRPAHGRPQSSYSTTSSTGSGGPSSGVHTGHGSTASLGSTGAAGGLGGIKKKGPAVAPRRGAKKLKYVIALYDYEARSDAEFDMKEGDRFLLKNKDAGDGWTEVEKGGRLGSVPSNYIADE